VQGSLIGLHHHCSARTMLGLYVYDSNGNTPVARTLSSIQRTTTEHNRHRYQRHWLIGPH
jgi:hypothetical protein